MFSAALQESIRALVFLAAAQPETYVRGEAIARSIDRPFFFLTKNLTRLSHGGLLQTKRGANGGVRLARPASEITLMQVASALGEQALFDACVLGAGRCNTDRPCAIHPEWGGIKARLIAMMNQTTLAQIAPDFSLSAEL
ncbi:MAG: Rrf2 family transcriptional regulator [Campylobacterales bacterium]